MITSRLLEGHGCKKHSCHYCPKHFKYLKGIYNHYSNNFCRVRAQLLAGKGLSALDQSHEAELQASLQQQAWNKMENRDHTDVIQGRAHLHDDGTITHTKRKGGWPKGLKRSNRRRRHCWTYIKRRKLDSSGSETASSPGKKPNSSTGVNSAASSSGSATSAAMSELEARLREPPVKAKRKRLNKELLAPPEHIAASQATKGADMRLLSEQTPACKIKGRKLSKVLEDLSQAPVIDRMDTVPPTKPRNGKQMSPDLEPPVLSPISSLASPTNLSHNSTQGKRRRKGKSVTSEASQSKVKKAGGYNTVPLAMKANSPAVLVPQVNPATGQVVFMPQVSPGEGVTAPIFVLEQMTDPSGAKGTQYKLVQLKLPAANARLPPQVSLLQHVTGTKVADQNKTAPVTSQASLNSVHGMEQKQKPLPPNFLFPPPVESVEQEEGKSPVSTAAGGAQDGQGEVTRSRKRKPRKKGATGDTPATPKINTLFKNRKSPTRANANTLKNMDVYRYEKTPLSTTPSTATLPESSVAATAAFPMTSSTSKALHPSGAPLVSPSSMTVLPPGSLLAVLPSNPIMLQTSPSHKPSTLSPASHVSTSSALQMAAAEGKLLLLDPRSLPGLLASGALPGLLASGSLSGAASPTQGIPKVHTIMSPLQQTLSGAPAVQTPPKSQPSPSGSFTTSREQETEKDSPLPLQPTRPAVDVPNFLFDKMDTSIASSTSDNQTSAEQKSKEMDNDGGNGKKQGSQLVDEKSSSDLKQKTMSVKKKPKRGPPPSSKMFIGSKVKSMMMMTSPGVHTMVSLGVSPVSTPQSTCNSAVTTDSTAIETPGDATSQDNSDEKQAPTATMTPGDATSKDSSDRKKDSTATVAPGDATSKGIVTRGKKDSTTVVTPGDATSQDNSDIKKDSTTIVTRGDATSRDNCDEKKDSTTIVTPGDATSKDHSTGKKDATAIMTPGDATSKGNVTRGKKEGTRVSPARAVKNKGDNRLNKEGSRSDKGETAQGKGSLLKVPVVKKRRDDRAASRSRHDVASDDDMPLSAVAAKIKDN